MKQRLFLTVSLLAPAFGFAATAVAAPATPILTQDAADASLQSEFGEPLTVNGVRIPDMAIKRFLVYGPGRNALEARKLQALMDHERELRRTDIRSEIEDEFPTGDESSVEAELNKRMKRYDHDPEGVKRRLESEKADFQERYPSLDHETELERAYRSGDWYRAQVRQTAAFDQLFFPDHPDTWPELAVEAINAASPEVDLIADYQREYERRLSVSQESGEPIIPEQEMMMSLLRDFVMNALWSLADVKTGTQGIPYELAMVIDGGDWRVDISTQDVYQEMKDYFTAQDIEDAKLCLALIEAGRQKLDASGSLMPEDEFITMVSGLRTAMADSMFNMDFLALQGHGFPSPEAYEQHLRLVESYKKLVEDKLVIGEDGALTPELQGHMNVANSIMGLARAHADLLLVSAFDFPNNEWKEDGWQTAYDRASGLREQIDAYLVKVETDRAARAKAAQDGVNYEPTEVVLPFDRWWSDFLRSNSEYYDPPLPATGKAPPAIGLKNFGAFQGVPMTRNDMKRAIGESEYEHFLSNGAIVDKIFFDMEPGSVAGPFRGPKGYYIVYLRSRTAPTNPLNMSSNTRHREMVQEDWARKSMQQMCHEALQEATLTGL